jgi:putative chitinase
VIAAISRILASLFGGHPVDRTQKVVRPTLAVAPTRARGVTLDQLQRIMPRAGARAAVYHPWLAITMDEFDIDTVARRAAFLATVAHESAHLTRTDENLNYSIDRLPQVWPRRFPTASAAAPYARNPQALANHVYADRMGNGNEASGDGWTYRGVGLIQLTGKGNHAACAAHFGIPLDRFGAWIRTPEGAARSAGWFWATFGLNEIADKGDQSAVCKRVNGGLNGLAERVALFRVAQEVLS